MNEIRQEEIGELEFVGNDFPLWSINNFIQNTTTNYLKILTLRKIGRLFANEASDRDFIIGTSSFNIYPDEEDVLEETYHPSFEFEVDFVRLASKEESARMFWHYFRYLRRPIVLFRNRPLYDIKSSEALILQDLSIRSPVKITLRGAINTLLDLFRGQLTSVRDMENIERSLNNVREIVETSHLIEDHRTRPGVRQYAINQLEAIMNKQNIINRKMGIRNIRFRP